MKHIQPICSLESKLDFISICSIRIPSRNRVIVKKHSAAKLEPLCTYKVNCSEMKLISLFFLHLTQAMYFWLAPATKKCIKEEVHKDVVVTGEFSVSDTPGHVVSLLHKGTHNFRSIIF